jgi:hypothetical protein
MDLQQLVKKMEYFLKYRYLGTRRHDCGLQDSEQCRVPLFTTRLLETWERKQNNYRCTQGLQGTGAARKMASNAAFL